MVIFKKASELGKYIESQLISNKIIGFVPTMGALHSGHISLVASAQKDCDITVCSIFVNPTQFNNATDFAKYPNTIDADIDLLLDVKCTVLYLPDVEDIYPNGTSSLNNYDLGGLDTRLEGEFRPGHFQGVANVMHRLLGVVKPHYLYMGIKDYQQCKVVAQLISITQLPTELKICDTLREPSGLAMSSRNQRLSAKGKEKAAVIHKSMQYIKTHHSLHSFALLQQKYEFDLVTAGLQPEHLILAERTLLNPLLDFARTGTMVLLTAAVCEGVRLIDNLEL